MNGILKKSFFALIVCVLFVGVSGAMDDKDVCKSDCSKLTESFKSFVEKFAINSSDNYRKKLLDSFYDLEEKLVGCDAFVVHVEEVKKLIDSKHKMMSDRLSEIKTILTAVGTTHIRYGNISYDCLGEKHVSICNGRICDCFKSNEDEQILSGMQGVEHVLKTRVKLYERFVELKSLECLAERNINVIREIQKALDSPEDKQVSFRRDDNLIDEMNELLKRYSTQ